MSPFGRRLKAARLKAGLSQEQLGIEAELDPASASARMNRYELGKRVPNFELVEKLSTLLNVPVAYFYTSDEDMSQLLLNLHRLSKSKRQKVMQFVAEIADKK